MDYLISPPDRTSWSIDTSEFLSKLIEHWPNARVRRTDDPHFTHAWEIQMPGGTLEGELNPGRSGIGIDGDFKDCASFALWFRSLVPPTQPLLFYDNCFSVDVPLTSETTIDDLRAAFG